MTAARRAGRTIMSKRNWLGLTASLLLSFAAVPADAQSYPNGQIKILVGFPPGGTTDIIARDVGQELEKAWHQTVIVENRAGANGALAAAQLAKLPPDGHTLMMIVSGHITNPLVSASAGYDVLKDFTNIGLLASSPLLIFAHPGFAANDIKGAIALAKEKPNTIGYATPGVGSIQQLSMELLSYLSGAKFLHVPYRGGAPALNDTIGGHVPISVLSVFQVLPLIQDGKLKPLAVTALKRNDVLPNVQTVAEAGVANYEASLLFGLIAPAGLPPAVLAKINAEVTRIIKDPAMQKKLAAQGVLPIASTPGDFTAVIKAEQEKWAQVIKAANIKE
jgi:tripartite-type tricarboxylate transporter receptor subunit TctC